MVFQNNMKESKTKSQGKATVAKLLQQSYCSKATAAKLLQQSYCSKATVAKLLQQSYASKV